jgi:hypothetical protein
MRTLAILVMAATLHCCREEKQPPPQFIRIDNGPIYRPDPKRSPTPTPSPQK